MLVHLPNCKPSSQLNFWGGNMDNLYQVVLKGDLNYWRNGNSSSKKIYHGMVCVLYLPGYSSRVPFESSVKIQNLKITSFEPQERIKRCHIFSCWASWPPMGIPKWAARFLLVINKKEIWVSISIWFISTDHIPPLTDFRDNVITLSISLGNNYFIAIT